MNQAARRDADRMVDALRAGLELRDRPAPPVLTTIATEGVGVDALLEAIDARLGDAAEKGVRDRRLARARRRIRGAVDRRRASRFWGPRGPQLDVAAAAVVDGAMGVSEAARGLAAEEEER